MVLDAGLWAGMTLYPETKCTPARAWISWKFMATNDLAEQRL
jgi:predicted metal-dependent TIM-barrel fold hydrolase